MEYLVKVLAAPFSSVFAGMAVKDSVEALASDGIEVDDE
jgi:hypothetical protein